MVIDFTDVKTAQAQRIADLEAQVRTLKLQLQGAKDATLIFESRFESGNLLAAIKISN